MNPPNRKDARPDIANFKPKIATFPNDRYAGTIDNRLVFYKTQAKMGQWQPALHNMAD